MKLNKLHIKSKFKNLNIKSAFDFSNQNGVSVVIGNNGSGKSNLLEAISSIFACLYDPTIKEEFSYNIQYELSKNKIEIDFKIKTSTYTYKINNRSVDSLSEENLPSMVISAYSGEELRIWNKYYFNFYVKYAENIRTLKANIDIDQKMIFINKYHWDIALLTMIISDLEVKDIVGDITIKKIDIEFNEKNIQNLNNWNQNEVTAFAKTLFDNKKNLNVDKFKKIIPYDTHLTLFKKLTIARLPKNDEYRLINNITLQFTNGTTTDDLSEGEKKQILLKFITRILALPNSLLLLDEPDSQIHIAKKELIKNLLFDEDEKPHVNSIITTHSPTLTQCFNNSNVLMLNNGSLVEKEKKQIIEELTDGFWSKQEQNIFINSDKPLLLVEGKGDIEYIQKAIDVLPKNSNKLSLDILHFGGTGNAKAFLENIKKCTSKDKRIIVLFDRDGAGAKGMKTCINFDKGIENKNTYKKDNIIFLMLPATTSHSKDVTDFLIEDYFSNKKKEDIAQKYILKAKNAFNKYPKDLKQNIKDDLGKNVSSYTHQDLVGFDTLFEKIITIIEDKEEFHSEKDKEKSEPQKKNTKHIKK